MSGVQIDQSAFAGLTPGQIRYLEDEARRMGRAIRKRREARERRAAQPVTEGAQEKYPPDPYWGTDDRGRFRYVDYDGESVHIRHDDGDVWIDKKGEGPVYIRQEHVDVIIAALKAEQ